MGAPRMRMDRFGAAPSGLIAAPSIWLAIRMRSCVRNCNAKWNSDSERRNELLPYTKSRCKPLRLPTAALSIRAAACVC